jgi:hypothetical protein
VNAPDTVIVEGVRLPVLGFAEAGEVGGAFAETHPTMVRWEYLLAARPDAGDMVLVWRGANTVSCFDPRQEEHRRALRRLAKRGGAT